MKHRVLVFLMLITAACSVVAERDFEDIPYFPESVDVARESYKSKVIRAPYSPFFQDVLSELYGSRSRDVFDLRGKNIAWTAAPHPGDVLSVSKLKCPKGLECLVMRTQAGIFLITFEKNYKKMIDHSMIYANEYWRDEDKGRDIRKKTLHSLFGDMDPWRSGRHMVDFKESGIFCSGIDGQAEPRGGYKRRINAIGIIEYKKLSDWRECRAPW